MITDHHNKHTKFEILLELPNCDKRHIVSKCCWENGADRLVWHRVGANLQFVNNSISVKHNKAKCNKTGIPVLFLRKHIK